MAITYQSAGAFAYSASGGTSVSPAYPASIAAGDLLLLIVGQKPSAANGGSCSTPSGWTALTPITGAGGYGATLGADTGNTNLYGFWKEAAGSESGSLAVTVGANNVCWAAILRLSNDSGRWSVASATGSDTSAGNVSIAFGADPGVKAADYVIGGMCIPTDVTTPSQFSAEAFTQTGVTFGTVSEVAEADSGNGNDIGGFLCRAAISSGTSSAAPTMTATAGGTTTNVRGPGIFVRIRELPKLVADAGSCPIGGTAASLIASRKLIAESGAVPINGTAASLSKLRRLAADPGSCPITGASASLIASRKLSAESGAVPVNGASAGLGASRRLAADAGPCPILGTAAALIAARKLSAESGGVPITGAAAGLRASRRLAAAPGAIDIAGVAAALRAARRFAAEAGALPIAGGDAEFTLGGAAAGDVLDLSQPAGPPPAVARALTAAATPRQAAPGATARAGARAGAETRAETGKAAGRPHQGRAL